MSKCKYSILVLEDKDLFALDLLKKVSWVYVGDISDMSKSDQDEELESIREIFNNAKN